MRKTRTLLTLFFSSRVFVDTLLVLLAFFSPWWFALLAGALFFFIFDGFVELLLLALQIDLLYGSSSPLFFGSSFVLSLGALLLYVLLSVVRRKMRF